MKLFIHLLNAAIFAFLIIAALVYSCVIVSCMKVAIEAQMWQALAIAVGLIFGGVACIFFLKGGK